MLDGRKKNGWLENFGHKDQSIDSIFQDKICQPFNNLPSGSKVWEQTVFDCMVCRSRVECQMIRKAFMIYIDLNFWLCLVSENSRENGNERK